MLALCVNKKVTRLGETLLNITCDVKTTLFYKIAKDRYIYIIIYSSNVI